MNKQSVAQMVAESTRFTTKKQQPNMFRMDPNGTLDIPGLWRPMQEVFGVLGSLFFGVSTVSQQKPQEKGTSFGLLDEV